MQMNPVVRSRRNALREAQTWLLARAREMNDPHARQVLNVTAFAFGYEMLCSFDPETGRSDRHKALIAKRGKSGIKPERPESPVGEAK